MASQINNLNTVTSYICNIFIIFAVCACKMASFNSGRPRDRGSGSDSSRPRVVFGNTVPTKTKFWFVLKLKLTTKTTFITYTKTTLTLKQHF